MDDIRESYRKAFYPFIHPTTKPPPILQPHSVSSQSLEELISLWSVYMVGLLLHLRVFLLLKRSCSIATLQFTTELCFSSTSTEDNSSRWWDNSELLCFWYLVLLLFYLLLCSNKRAFDRVRRIYSGQWEYSWYLVERGHPTWLLQTRDSTLMISPPDKRMFWRATELRLRLSEWRTSPRLNCWNM